VFYNCREPTIREPLHIKRHRLVLVLRVVHRRVFHHFRVHLIAVLAGFVDDEREDNGLVGFDLCGFPKGVGDVLRCEILRDAFEVLQGAVFHPYFTAHLGHLFVGFQVLGGDGDQEAVDVGHGKIGMMQITQMVRVISYVHNPLRAFCCTITR
jgi:hypothetical protein